MKKKIFIYIHPDHLGKRKKRINKILVLDAKAHILLDDVFSCDSYNAVKEYLRSDTLLITYDGFLLCEMILSYWNTMLPKSKVLNLMQEFSPIFGEKDSSVYNYDWGFEIETYKNQSLQTALAYSGVRNNKVDLEDPYDISIQTYSLYYRMKKNNWLEVMNESEV